MTGSNQGITSLGAPTTLPTRTDVTTIQPADRMISLRSSRSVWPGEGRSGRRFSRITSPLVSTS